MLTVYLDLVILLNFIVDFLLLLGANRLCGHSSRWGRLLISAGVGGLYGGACLLPGFYFLGNFFWRLISLAVMSWLAFGFHMNALRRGLVFVLLSMALGGIALGLGRGGVIGVLTGAGCLCLICVFGFKERLGSVSYIPVDLFYGDKQMHLTALKDTGNTLRDPVTGRPVLVVASEVAESLIGLTKEQLKRPVDTLTSAPVSGLRLVPYRSVGQDGGLLLAMRFQRVKIGSWMGSTLVAFAPMGLSKEGDYQALAGGVV